MVEKLNPEKLKELMDKIEELNPDAQYPTGFEEALIGYVDQFRNGGRYILPVVSWDLMVEILVERDGMAMDEAIEFIDFNTLGAYVSENQAVYFFEQ